MEDEQKVKRKIKKVFIAAVLMLLSLLAGILTACGKKQNQEELTKQQGYSYCITYDANGGSFGSNSTLTYALVKKDSLAPAPGYVDAKTQASVKLPTRRNYRLLGGVPKTNDDAIKSDCWYLAAMDENGNVLRDENGMAVFASDKPWDFAKDRVTEDITLVAAWEEVYRYLLCLTDVDENGKTFEKELRAFVVKPGDSVAAKLYDKVDGEYVDRADYIRITEKDYTLLDFYMDEALTQDLDFGYVHPGQREVEETVIDPETNEPVTQTVKTNDVKIYAKYLHGDFELITKASVAKKALKLSYNSNWYLLEDVDLTVDNLITGGQEPTIWEKVDVFEGVIYGNGHSISGFCVNSQAIRPAYASGVDYTQHSIFGQMNGILSDLTLKGGVFTVNVANAYMEAISGEQRVAFLAYDFGENGRVSNVTLEDCQIVLANHDKYQSVINEEAGAVWYVKPTAEQATVTILRDGVEVDVLTPSAA